MKMYYLIYKGDKQMYNFDMNALLNAFNNDPAQLADAFTAQLNTALMARKRKEQLETKANDVAETWNIFVKDFFDFYKNKYPNSLQEDYFINGDTIIDILTNLIQLLPDINKYLKVYDTLAAQAEKFVPIKDKTIEKIQTKSEDFSKTMKDFLKNNGINF